VQRVSSNAPVFCSATIQRMLSTSRKVQKNLQDPAQTLFITQYVKVYFVRFQVLTAENKKMDVFWVVAPCSLVENYRIFRGACCFHHQGDLVAFMLEAASTSETSVIFYQTSRRNNPEDSHQGLFCRCWSYGC
jgi:hypothetical protein